MGMPSSTRIKSLVEAPDTAPEVIDRVSLQHLRNCTANPILYRLRLECCNYDN